MPVFAFSTVVLQFKLLGRSQLAMFDPLLVPVE